MNLQNAFLVCLLPEDGPSEWWSAAAFLQTQDSCPIAKSVFLVRTPDATNLGMEVESRLSAKATFVLCPIGLPPIALKVRGSSPDTLRSWLYEEGHGRAS
jgi:hypothetical protein